MNSKAHPILVAHSGPELLEVFVHLDGTPTLVVQHHLLLLVQLSLTTMNRFLKYFIQRNGENIGVFWLKLLLGFAKV
jgi:hypothetical protein